MITIRISDNKNNNEILKVTKKEAQSIARVLLKNCNEVKIKEDIKGILLGSILEKYSQP